MKVYLIYYKPSGKYYTSGSYETEFTMLHDIWDEVEYFARMKILPDLMVGHSDFIVSIDVPEHTCNHPHLINVKEAIENWEN